MRAIPSVAPTVATFELQDRQAHADRVKRYQAAFRDAYNDQREEYAVAVAPCDDPVWHSYCRLTSCYETRIAKLERALLHALASDALTDEGRDRILRAQGIKTRDANLLTAAETQHLTEYRALDEPDRRIVRSLIARLSGEGNKASSITEGEGCGPSSQQA